MIKRVYNTSKSLPDLFANLYVPIATIQLLPTPDSSEQKIAENMTIAPTRPSMLSVLLTVSTVHLSLLIAAARLEAIHNLITTNFNLVYNHYTELITRSKLQQTASGAFAVGAGLRQWSRETAERAWEDLSGWHLVVPATIGVSGKDGSGDTIGGEGASVRMCRVDVTLDELNWSLKEKRGGMVNVLEKWCREV